MCGARESLKEGVGRVGRQAELVTGAAGESEKLIACHHDFVLSVKRWFGGSVYSVGAQVETPAPTIVSPVFCATRLSAPVDETR